ncbi:MAG: hypothetical protein QNK23_09390 [Crocinitomicaceae bacterium]|nr:hypothetical protein [Crocinitomicaceae bacterium]
MSLLQKILIVLIVANTNFLYSQDFSTSSICKESNLKNFMGSDDDYLVFWDLFKYETVNRKTGEKVVTDVTTLYHGDMTGIIYDLEVRDGHIYEIARFVGKGRAITSCKVGFIKRNIETMKIVGDIEWVGDFSIWNYYDKPYYLDLHQYSGGFYLQSRKAPNGDQNSFLAQYDEDLNMQWRTDLNYLAVNGVSYDELLFEDNGNVLMKVEFKDVENAIKTRSGDVFPTGLSLFSFGADGDYIVITPELNETEVYNYNYFGFDEKSQELFGIFMISELDETGRKKVLRGQGYKYMRWDAEGNLLESSRKMFTYEDFWNEEAEEFMKVRGVERTTSNDDQFPRFGDVAFKVFVKENGNLIVTFGEIKSERLYRETSELINSNLIFEIDTKGEFLWSRLIPKRRDGLYNDEIFIMAQDKLYIINKEFSEFFTNGGYKMHHEGIRAGAENTCSAVIVLDTENGEIVERKTINEDMGEGFMYNGILSRKYPDDYMYETIMIHTRPRKNQVKYTRVTF